MGMRGGKRRWKITGNTAEIVLLVSKMGEQYVLTLPRGLVEEFGLNHGDYIHVTIRRMVAA